MPPPPPPPPPPTDAAAPDEARPSEREAAADDGPEPKDTDEFTAEEAEHAAAPVILDAGRYAVRAGEEFDVTLTLTAPALSNVMLLMEFDPALLACLPASGKRVGWTFRQDIEFYANNDKGQLILISQGQPGAKHTRAVVDRPVASFRLKAKAAGQTALKFPAKGVEFTTAKGVAAEAPQLRGGAIEIR
ncbi:MAG: hypothetical protein BWZ02_03286 [Lentisphaerae bacterium ADurb.BinA184]|nr:MAG: hypothetical protein BWZ02_03286 [Lentisphaerae bacterium ADurb.BinA184]